MEGSAKYLKNQVESKDIASVVMRADYTTNTVVMDNSVMLTNKRLCNKSWNIYYAIGYNRILSQAKLIPRIARA